MAFTVVFSPLALTDMEQAVEYYNKAQPGLGARFASQVQLALTAVKRNPFFASVRYDDIRCTQVKKFPYLIHYHIDEPEQLVTIIAVYASYKEPFW